MPSSDLEPSVVVLGDDVCIPVTPLTLLLSLLVIVALVEIVVGGSRVGVREPPSDEDRGPVSFGMAASLSPPSAAFFSGDGKK